MVRLKEVQARALFQAWESFNSTMVRLKELSEYVPDMVLTSFNSTMVRLKVHEALQVVRVPRAVSIPLWYD